MGLILNFTLRCARRCRSSQSDCCTLAAAYRSIPFHRHGADERRHDAGRNRGAHRFPTAAVSSHTTDRRRRRSPTTALAHCATATVRDVCCCCSESCAEPLLRYTSVDVDGGALVPWLVSRHEASGVSGAAVDIGAAPIDEGRTNLASQLSCENFERFESEVEWTRAVEDEVRSSANQLLRNATGSLPQPAPTNLNDAMVHCRLLNYAVSLPVQAIHAERQQALAKEKEKEAQAQAQAAFPFMTMPMTMPMNPQPFMPFFPPSPFMMPGNLPSASGRTSATAGSSTIPPFFGSTAPFSFSPGANHLASVLLNLDPAGGSGSATGSAAAASSTAPALSSVATSSVATRPLLGASQPSRGMESKRVPLSPMGALHSLASISTAPHAAPVGAFPPPSPSSSLASQALLGIGAPPAVSTSSPHRKRPAPSGLMQPPAQKATGDRRARIDSALHAQTLAALQAARPAAAVAPPAKSTLSPPKPHRLSQRKSAASAGATTPTAHSASSDTTAGSFLPLTVLANQAV